MSNIVAIQPGKALITFDEPKMELIRKTVAKDLSALEFEYFISVAQARGLDPILKQIYAVKRNGELIFQVGIDGGRVVAARTGEYAGSDRPVFEKDEDGSLIAHVTVWRIVQGVRSAFTGTAYWHEFVPPEKQAFMWKKMPRSQLSKCAEMQALRKGFPNDLSGMYEPAEMERDVSSAEENLNKELKGALDRDDDTWIEKLNTLLGKFRKIGVTEAMICQKYSIDAAFDLSEEQVAELNNIGASIVRGQKKAADCFPAEHRGQPA